MTDLQRFRNGGGWVETVMDGDSRTLTAVGRWVIATAQALGADLDTVKPEPGPRLRLDLGRLEAVDTVGALLLLRFQARLGAAGSPLKSREPARHAALIEAVRTADRRCDHTLKDTRHPLVAMVERTGVAALQAGREALDLLNFLGMMVSAMARTVASPRRLRGIALVHHIEQTGLNALPIVGLLSFLIGVVLAYQGADQLRQFGAELFVVNLLGISILREIGILMTSIIIAGRSGSAFTAQIGTMKVNQEVDALRTLGLDPTELLVLPRALALMITLPLLAFLRRYCGPPRRGGYVLFCAGYQLRSVRSAASWRDQAVHAYGGTVQGTGLRLRYSLGRLP